MNKKAFIYHPIGLASITFIVGALIMWLICKGIIPTGGVSIC
tara:strand:- start:1454 stop:1579 length:126 start_codon:yes stop_codon:yes gene_type:complete